MTAAPRPRHAAPTSLSQRFDRSLSQRFDRSLSQRFDRLEQVDHRLGDAAIRWVATGVVGVTLLAVGAAAGASPRPHPQQASVAIRYSAEVAPQPIVLPVPAHHAVAHPAAKALPRAHRVAPKAVKHVAAAPKRWLPTGTGMWLHDYSRTEGGNGKAIVNRAVKSALTTLYVRTGSSHDGWTGTEPLRSILPATKGTSIKVVAWDFPTLVNPGADAVRLARAANAVCAGCPRVAAVAPDVETAAEGTRISDHAVAYYYAVLRKKLPRNIAILATVPWPSENRTGRYPYARTAKMSDALLPMAYWYNRSPQTVTATSMSFLARYRKPIMPVGQGYDARLDAPYLPADPHPGASVMTFLLTAHQHGARAVSLWSWQTTGTQQWAALTSAHTIFPAVRKR